MKKITLNELDDVEKVECVEINVCTRVKACKWKGTRPQLDFKRIDNSEDEYVCPECGNNQFYIEYMPLHKYQGSYVDRNLMTMKVNK